VLVYWLYVILQDAINRVPATGSPEESCSPSDLQGRRTSFGGRKPTTVNSNGDLQPRRQKANMSMAIPAEDMAGDLTQPV